MICTVN